MIIVEPPTPDIGFNPVIKITPDDTNIPIPIDTVGTATIAMLPGNGRYTIHVNIPGYEPIIRKLDMNCKTYQPETCSPVIVLKPVSTRERLWDKLEAYLIFISFIF